MKKLIEQQKALIKRATSREQYDQAKEDLATAQDHLKKHEKTYERASAHVNKERRRFLDMIGKAGVSSSVIKASSLLGGVFATRHAMAAGGPQRVIFCYLDSGAPDGQWLPRGVSNMNAITEPYGPGGYNVSSICHFREVNVHLAGHSAAIQSLGVTSHGSPTIDARIAPILSATTPYNAMYLGSGATSSGALCSNIGPCVDDPAIAFQRYFASPLPEGSTDETYLRVFESQARAIDSIRSKLGQDEWDRLQKHQEALNKIEDGITRALAGEGPDLDTYRPSLPSASSYAGKIVARGRVQVDIMLSAMKAGLTNVGVLQLGNHQGDWVGDGTRFRGNLHNCAHANQPSSRNDFNELIRHLSDVPAHCIRRLMDEEGPDGQKMIDSTVFVQVTCMGNGMNHESNNAPFLVATRMPGFRSGYSASATGATEDLNGAVPKGMGLDPSLYAPMGSSTLGIV